MLEVIGCLALAPLAVGGVYLAFAMVVGIIKGIFGKK